MPDLKYWIALSLLPDIGPVRAKKLLTVFGTAGDIFRADFDDLTAVDGIGVNRAKNIREFSSWKLVDEKIHVMHEKGIKAVHPGEASYPK